jgi:hypothetical protein
LDLYLELKETEKYKEICARLLKATFKLTYLIGELFTYIRALVFPLDMLLLAINFPIQNRKYAKLIFRVFFKTPIFGF